jgi:hypothetical protein
MNVDELIAEAERLKQVNYDDPDQDLWDNDVREFVKPFGDTTYRILERIISPSSVILGDDDSQFMLERVEAITKTQKLLERLNQRSVDKQAAQSKTIAPSFEQAKQQIKDKTTSYNYNINAPTTFGDNSPISEITIGEFLAGLEKEIEEKVSDDVEKHRLLTMVKSVTTDPSFVAIASVAATSIMKRLLGG